MIKTILKRFRTKPTLFLFLVPIVFIWAIPVFCIDIQATGGGSLAAIVPMAAMFIAGIALWIDYGLVNYSRIKLLWISVIEAGLLSCFILFHLYSDRSVSINIEKSNYPYLIIIDKPTGLKPKDFRRVRLFDKEYSVINTNILYLDEASFTGFPINVTGNSNGVTIKFGHEPKYRIKWAFYYNYNYESKDYSYSTIDSLISLHLKPGEKLYKEN